LPVSIEGAAFNDQVAEESEPSGWNRPDATRLRGRSALSTALSLQS